jgi:arylformamidase
LILELYETRSRQARTLLPDFQTWAYGAAEEEKLDLFRPASLADGESRPTLIYFHGGYWQELNKDLHAFPAPALSGRGWIYAAVGYGLAPTATLERIVERSIRSVAWLAHNAERLGIDIGRIYVAGSSAGAHLAAMIALSDWRPYGLRHSPVRSVCLLSGIFDLRPLLPTYINDALRLTAQEALKLSPQLLLETSNERLPSMLVAFGDNETEEFKRQSRDFAAAAARRAHVETFEARNRNHFDLPLDLAESGTPLGERVVSLLGGVSNA